MTIPEERRRNLVWGHGVLAELSRDAELPAGRRDEAGELLAAYPPLDRLREADTADLDRLQAEFVDVLAATKWLFRSVKDDLSCSPERRYRLLVVLRHFG